MKKDLHSTTYRPVVFQDLNDNTTYLTQSTVATKDTIKLDGTEYPLVKVHISSSTHPFFTGQEKMLDIEGRVDKFKARQEAATQKREEATKRATKKAKKAAADSDEEPKAVVQKLGTAKLSN